MSADGIEAFHFSDCPAIDLSAGVENRLSRPNGIRDARPPSGVNKYITADVPFFATFGTWQT